MPGNLAFFREEITGISSAAYGDTKLFQFGFQARNVRIRYVSGSDPIFFSFNGADDSGKVGLSAGMPTEELFRELVTNVIYFRGGDGTEVIAVEAW